MSHFDRHVRMERRELNQGLTLNHSYAIPTGDVNEKLGFNLPCRVQVDGVELARARL